MRTNLKSLLLLAVTAACAVGCATQQPVQQLKVVCPPPPLTELQQSQLRLYVNDALHGEDQHERNNGIRALETVPSPEGIAVLMQAARQDPEAANRMLALNVMIRLAQQGHETVAIRDTLRQIAEDKSSGIGPYARDAYNEVLKVAPLE